MKFVSFINKSGAESAGIVISRGVIEIRQAAIKLGYTVPATMGELLENWDNHLVLCRKIAAEYENDNSLSCLSQPSPLLSPVPRPASCRDGYAFRQHVEAARKNRGVEMIPEFDEYPVFYFTNHLAVFGEGEILVEEDHLLNLDFELEAAIVIGKSGKNISSVEADDYIAGYMIMNDISARVLQMEEMKLNLGPAKGKDFATTLGPYLVTPDELEPYISDTPFGKKYNLGMKAFHNGRQVSAGNMLDMNWTFAELIERASYGVQLHAGDVIGSGTVGTGCYLELNGTDARIAKENNREFTPVWLREGDEIVMEIEHLGRLSNTIRKNDTHYSIMAKKKRTGK